MEKFKVWLKATGLKNIGWIGGMVIAFLIGWKFVSGACFAFFIQLNGKELKELLSKLFVKIKEMIKNSKSQD